MPNWFHRITGFCEGTYPETQARLQVDGTMLRSRVNGRSWGIGTLETPALSELCARGKASVRRGDGRLRVSSVISDVAELHARPDSRHVLFQVASQFNVLEMAGPDVTPEDGVTRYMSDPTQGPACAIAAGAATIYRNYFVPVAGAVGQTRDRQIDCLCDIGAALGNRDGRLWDMRNGYAFCTADGLQEITDWLGSMTEDARDALRGRLRVGVQRDVEVTVSDRGHLVSQVFCSALPVAYTSVPMRLWEPFARIVLEATYEASMWAAAENMEAHGCATVYLTLVGGGAFGNDVTWIDAAIRRALARFSHHALDVRIVSRGTPPPMVQRIVKDFV